MASEAFCWDSVEARLSYKTNCGWAKAPEGSPCKRNSEKHRSAFQKGPWHRIKEHATIRVWPETINKLPWETWVLEAQSNGPRPDFGSLVHGWLDMRQICLTDCAPLQSDQTSCMAQVTACYLSTSYVMKNSHSNAAHMKMRWMKGTQWVLIWLPRPPHRLQPSKPEHACIQVSLPQLLHYCTKACLSRFAVTNIFLVGFESRKPNVKEPVPGEPACCIICGRRWEVWGRERGQQIELPISGSL